MPPPEPLRIADEVEAAFTELCLKVNLGKSRVFEVAIFCLADAIERQDPAALAAVAMWRDNRDTIQIAEDALEVARLKAGRG